MKFFHTADWHLGKLIQNVYMTEDQAYILEQFIADIEAERPDAVVVAGDLYDRAVPPTEAVALLDRTLQEIVLRLGTPVIAVAGNHDSPSRLNFGSGLMRAAGLHMCGQLAFPAEPAVLHDEHGPVHFHLVPFADPAAARIALGNPAIRSHDDAMAQVAAALRDNMDPAARHVLVGHAFVTPRGEAEPNTSDSERPLAIGGTEHVSAAHFNGFHYTALGHLHQAHFVGSERVQYAGSPLKYSISEERHQKGYLIVELDGEGGVQVEKRLLSPRRDMRTVAGYMEDIERHAPSDDYVYIRLLDERPVLSPMERARAVYRNAMHIERAAALAAPDGAGDAAAVGSKAGMDMLTLFRAFYREAKGADAAEDTERLFLTALRDIESEEDERHAADPADDDGFRAV